MHLIPREVCTLLKLLISVMRVTDTWEGRKTYLYSGRSSGTKATDDWSEIGLFRGCCSFILLLPFSLLVKNPRLIRVGFANNRPPRGLHYPILFLLIASD